MARPLTARVDPPGGGLAIRKDFSDSPTAVDDGEYNNIATDAQGRLRLDPMQETIADRRLRDQLELTRYVALMTALDPGFELR